MQRRLGNAARQRVASAAVAAAAAAPTATSAALLQLPLRGAAARHQARRYGVSPAASFHPSLRRQMRLNSAPADKAQPAAAAAAPAAAATDAAAPAAKEEAKKEDEKKAVEEEEEEEEEEVKETPREREIRERKEAKLAFERRRALQLEHGVGTDGQPHQRFEDCTEFFAASATEMAAIKKTIQDAEDKESSSLLDYATSFGGWVVTKGKNTAAFVTMSSEERARRREKKKAKRASNRASSDEAMQQFYQSQELVNLMKFREVTFDNGVRDPDAPLADFEAFSRRICDNYDLFKRTEAYSNLAFHVVRDPSKSEKRFETDLYSNYKQIDEGGLTSWLTEEGSADAAPAAAAAADDAEAAEETAKKAEAAAAAEQQQQQRPPPFSVNYETGEVTVLDTCSQEEFLDFLLREAPRAEIKQMKINEEQSKLYEELATMVERVGIKGVVFNTGQTIITDREYKELKADGREKEYVMPADVMAAIKEINAKQWLYKKYLKGHTVRLLPREPKRAYFLDDTTNEVCLPCDFYKDTFLPIHKSYIRRQKVTNFLFRLRYIGCVIVITILGDVEWPAPWPLA
eukprot:Rhum_TRINITY_DN14637_c15_g1::Rhum_TRINITY_DN14637_c15_g1_i1::g.102695::m.102695